MAIHESDLPGIGKKFVVDLDDGSQLIVVIHNTGKRELFRRETPDEDSEKVFELSDRLARQVGTIMEGAYFQPISDVAAETVLGEDTIIEWVKIPPTSPVVGQTLGEADVRSNTGASIVAIQRGSETIQNPGPETTIDVADLLVIVGSQEAYQALDAFVSPEEDD